MYREPSQISQMEILLKYIENAYQKCIENPVKYLRWRFCKFTRKRSSFSTNWFTLVTFPEAFKTLHLSYTTLLFCLIFELKETRINRSYFNVKDQRISNNLNFQDLSFINMLYHTATDSCRGGRNVRNGSKILHSVGESVDCALILVLALLLSKHNYVILF